MNFNLFHHWVDFSLRKSTFNIKSLASASRRFQLTVFFVAFVWFRLFQLSNIEKIFPEPNKFFGISCISITHPFSFALGHVYIRRVPVGT